MVIDVAAGLAAVCLVVVAVQPQPDAHEPRAVACVAALYGVGSLTRHATGSAVGIVGLEIHSTTAGGTATRATGPASSEARASDSTAAAGATAGGARNTTGRGVERSVRPDPRVVGVGAPCRRVAGIRFGIAEAETARQRRDDDQRSGAHVR